MKYREELIALLTSNTNFKTLAITEEESLILWKALLLYMQEKEDNDKTNWLFAKIVYVSNWFGGSLEVGETIESIYNEMGE
jgi:hypothetical protein